MTIDDVKGRVDAVRRFNRFYTRQVGALGEGHLDTPFSLTEARVVYELAQRGTATATELGQELGLDAGYLSRILRGFQERGLIDRRPSDTDARQTRLSLTEAGRAAFAQLDAAARRDVGAMLDALPGVEQDRLVRAMGTVERVLGAVPEPAEPFILRDPRPGDLGWVVQIHGELYDREFGWNVRFEGLVADVIGGYVRSFDPARERCWIAERNGENVGSVFVMRGSDEVARLRLLVVDPGARGLGIGARLVDECIRFSREAGYRTLSLWTNSVLLSARRIYEARGFRLVHTEEHDSFGPDLTAETWEMDLQPIVASQAQSGYVIGRRRHREPSLYSTARAPTENLLSEGSWSVVIAPHLPTSRVPVAPIGHQDADAGFLGRAPSPVRKDRSRGAPSE